MAACEGSLRLLNSFNANLSRNAATCSMFGIQQVQSRLQWLPVNRRGSSYTNPIRSNAAWPAIDPANKIGVLPRSTGKSSERLLSQLPAGVELCREPFAGICAVAGHPSSKQQIYAIIYHRFLGKTIGRPAALSL